MTQAEKAVFLDLFKQVHLRCFGAELINALTESEAKHLSFEIEEATGLVLGWKSLKIYSQYLLSSNPDLASNPSVSSLDTLVRFIEKAPKTDEMTRKKYQDHYPFWFGFKERILATLQSSPASIVNLQKEAPANTKPRYRVKAILAFIVLITSLFFFFYFFKQGTADFTENFESLNSLKKNGWLIKHRDDDYLNKQNQETGKLCLYTLRGDNFEESDSVTGIKNMLLRSVDANSFSAEFHVTGFAPFKNWQQAGIILMEDTLPKSKTLRFSIGYNDFFGGFQKPGEVLLQVLSSTEEIAKPEEIIQTAIFQKTSEQDSLIIRNLGKSALRIEKSKSVFRFLYATGEKDIFAFKEIKTKELMLSPKYIGVYASSGNNRDATIIPVQLDKFVFQGK